MTHPEPDYFELLGVEKRFDLDVGELQSRYLQQARASHPDFAGADAEAQERAMEQAARVNEAHRVLADPESRAAYMLELGGGCAQEESKALPDGFLEEMVELREAVAEAQASHDAAKLQSMKDEALRRRQAHIERIAGLFRNNSPALPIRLELNALRYIHRVLEQFAKRP